jgi:hypothetical protein
LLKLFRKLCAEVAKIEQNSHITLGEIMKVLTTEYLENSPAGIADEHHKNANKQPAPLPRLAFTIKEAAGMLVSGVPGNKSLNLFELPQHFFA